MTFRKPTISTRYSGSLRDNQNNIKFDGTILTFTPPSFEGETAEYPSGGLAGVGGYPTGRVSGVKIASFTLGEDSIAIHNFQQRGKNGQQQQLIITSIELDTNTGAKVKRTRTMRGWLNMAAGQNLTQGEIQQLNCEFTCYFYRDRKGGEEFVWDITDDDDIALLAQSNV